MSAILRSVARSFAPTNLSASSSNIARKYSTGVLPRKDWRTIGRAPVSLSQDDALEEEDDDDAPLRTRHQAENFAPVQLPTPETWSTHRAAVKSNFPEGWAPPRKLSRDAMDGLRSLHAYDPETFTTPVLASKFRVSPEAVRRILRSRWQPTNDERARMVAREREQRSEWIATRREEEKSRLIALRKNAGRDDGVRNGHRRRWDDDGPQGIDRKDDDRPRGINGKDRLSLR
ncbi:hypothetical protein FA95DRAFT_1511014 [Auriscalpium vulgare]|uniref:Uncharacterized protein n=1 Tax=Auriscalpium vulgare TaxID=40419 RepID=A0ACB8S6P2_9AGAM|nr:hypothetical protein FA95DRAFT_1511014 [Auriscalpium vulgare]